MGLLGACAAQTQEEGSLLGSPAYSSGYADGCRTANNRRSGQPTEVTRNEAIYKTNRAYRAGYRAGYGACNGAGTASPSEALIDQRLQGR